jgi:hypothetical protein
MIYRILADTLDPVWDPKTEEVTSWEPSGTRLRGAFTSMADIPSMNALTSPNVGNGRTRFWFTEEGWRVAGKAVCAELRAAGHVVRVLRAKRPEPSRVVYRDRYQLALLPPSERR